MNRIAADADDKSANGFDQAAQRNAPILHRLGWFVDFLLIPLAAADNFINLLLKGDKTFPFSRNCHLWSWTWQDFPVPHVATAGSLTMWKDAYRFLKANGKTICLPWLASSFIFHTSLVFAGLVHTYNKVVLNYSSYDLWNSRLKNGCMDGKDMPSWQLKRYVVVQEW